MGAVVTVLLDGISGGVVLGMLLLDGEVLGLAVLVLAVLVLVVLVLVPDQVALFALPV